MNNRKPVIKRIKLTKAEQEEIDKINRHEPVKRIRIAVRKDGISYEYTTNRPLTEEVSRKRLIQLYGGKWRGCGVKWPDFKVIYDVGDEKQPAKRIERYCKKCMCIGKSG